MSGKIKGLSFRAKLLLIVELLVISSLLLSGAVIYKNIQNLNREILKKKLVAIAASTASVIDGDEIKKIQNIQDAQTETYQKINQTIFSIQKNNDDVGAGLGVEDLEIDPLTRHPRKVLQRNVAG